MVTSRFGLTKKQFTVKPITDAPNPQKSGWPPTTIASNAAQAAYAADICKQIRRSLTETRSFQTSIL